MNLNKQQRLEQYQKQFEDNFKWYNKMRGKKYLKDTINDEFYKQLQDLHKSCIDRYCS